MYNYPLIVYTVHLDKYYHKVCISEYFHIKLPNWNFLYSRMQILNVTLLK